MTDSYDNSIATHVYKNWSDMDVTGFNMQVMTKDDTTIITVGIKPVDKGQLCKRFVYYHPLAHARIVDDLIQMLKMWQDDFGASNK